MAVPLGVRNLMTKAAAVSLAAAALTTLTELAVAQGAAGDRRGQLSFNNACRTCHTLREGDNRLGPNLHRIIGRKAGALPDYGYSSAMKSGDLVWDKGTLDRFMADPDAVVPGHSMKPFGGVASAEERASIIEYLEQAGKD
jgi:cytochrome c